MPVADGSAATVGAVMSPPRAGCEALVDGAVLAGGEPTAAPEHADAASAATMRVTTGAAHPDPILWSITASSHGAPA